MMKLAAEETVRIRKLPIEVHHNHRRLARTTCGDHIKHISSRREAQRRLLRCQWVCYQGREVLSDSLTASCQADKKMASAVSLMALGLSQVVIPAPVTHYSRLAHII